MAAMRPKVFMSMASITASSCIWWASTTSMRAAAGYIPRLSRSDFQQTMVSNRPRPASASIRWNSGRFLDQPRPTSLYRAVMVSPLRSQYASMSPVCSEMEVLSSPSWLLSETRA